MDRMDSWTEMEEPKPEETKTQDAAPETEPEVAVAPVVEPGPRQKVPEPAPVPSPTERPEVVSAPPAEPPPQVEFVPIPPVSRKVVKRHGVGRKLRPGVDSLAFRCRSCMATWLAVKASPCPECGHRGVEER